MIKKLTRKEVLEELFNSLLVKLLQRRSRSLLVKNSKQLAIYAHDQIGTSINTVGAYEKFELEIFFEWIARIGINFNNSIAIDVGANIGNHSIYFAKYFSRVFAFEANPRTYQILKINATLVNNIEVFNYGISNSNGPLILSSHPNDVNGSSITTRLDYYPIEIEGLTLDSIEGLNNVSLLKIDVEGHEYQVIDGAKNLIRRFMPIILFEQHYSDFDDSGSSVVHLLKSLGYQKFAFIVTSPARNRGTFKAAITSSILSLIKSESVFVEISDNLKPGFYPFIVALPPHLLQ